MKSRRFDNTDVSEIGLGTWQLGSADWGSMSDVGALAILQAFADAGGNFIDTADVYGMGVSEKLIGRFLKGSDNKFHVATKFGRRGDEGNGWPQNFTYGKMRRHVESSLANLGVSKLFLEQLHCIPTEELKTGAVFQHLRRLQNEGLIQHWGVSVETSEEALLCLDQDGLASLQLIYNLFRQHVADEVFAKAKERGVAIIVRVPLASGLLSGKFSGNTHFAANDHRNFNANGEAFNAGETFSGIEFSEGVKLSRKMAAMLPEGSMARWALRWVLDHPEVTTVIPGASSVKQVLDNAGASHFSPLSREAHQKLRAFYDENIKQKIRGHY